MSPKTAVQPQVRGKHRKEKSNDHTLASERRGASAATREGAALAADRELTPEAGRNGLVAGLLAAAAVVWLLAWFDTTTWSIVSIWIRSQTFAHGFLILPISLYLIWNKRRELASMAPQPNYRALPLLALFGFLWLIGNLAGVLVVEQYSLVIMIALLIWLILGSRIARVLRFPVLFLLFAVPVGDFLLPPLMEFTADFTVFALQLTGIPVYRDGLFFTIPSGQWSVVEACSGLRYLIASFTLGCLYAYLNYRSIRRRTLFILLSIVVPIVANGLRAYMIVMIGHLSDMELATGVDHLVYGWVFFGLVTLLLFWIGSFWHESTDDHAGANPHAAAAAARYPSATRLAAAALAAVAVTIAWPLYADRVTHVAPPLPPVLEIPAGMGGWQAQPGALTDWTPHFQNPRAQFNQVYAKDGRRVGLYIGYYNYQRQGTELVNSENTLVTTFDKVWAKSGETGRTLTATGREIGAIETRLRSASAHLLSWHWYWVEGYPTVNPYFGKLLEAVSRLFGGGDDGAVVILYTPYEDAASEGEAPLHDFLQQMLPAIERTLDVANRG